MKPSQLSYATKVHGTVYAAGAFFVAAVVLGFVHLGWFAAVLCIAAVIGFIAAVRIARSGSESERRGLVDAGERAIGAAGRAEGGGWTPMRKRRRDE
jgi:hypothetical protein